MRTVACVFACCLLAACMAPTPTGTDATATDAAQPAPETRDLVALQAAMAQGGLSSVELTRHYLDRIAAIDDAGPRLNAVIALAPDALEQAAERDAERARGELRGPLHGIPVLLKDNIDVAGLPTTAGSLALASHRPAKDAPLVARLREAGAVILGKSNLSEWANFRSTRSSSGWSSAGGQTRNPYALDRSPCGSSSGSGVAVAARLAPLAVGTETNGSIICPAAVNGVVGIKPTLGLVSRSGIVPISPSQDTAGPMAASVADAAALLAAMRGLDPDDPVTALGRDHHAEDYTLQLDADALQGARIGVMRKDMGWHAGVDAVMESSIAALKAAGAIIVDPADLPTHGSFSAPAFEVLLYEFRPALEDYLRRSSAPIGSLDALITFNRDNRPRVMPWFEQELFTMAAAKGPLTDTAYLSAREDARRRAGEQGIEAILHSEHLDALLTTAVSPAWTVDLVNGDHFLGAGYSAAAIAGTPSITVPAGEVQGLPVGVVFMGAAFSEARLIGIAYAFEQATRARREPAYRERIGE
jgi:amidase